MHASEMPSFSFTTVPAFHQSWGACQTLGALLAPRFAQRSAMIVTFASFVARGTARLILADLAAHAFKITVFDQVCADPTDEMVLAAVAQARAAKVDIVIGIGGGSSLDVAKLVAVLSPSPRSLDTLYGIDKVEDDRLPLVLIPTTAGTGSEVTPISIVTTGGITKAGVVAPQLLPDLAVLDAALTVGLPAIHTAAGGIDAMVHAIEAYTSRHKKNPMSDLLAREALRLLTRHLLTACHDAANRPAREAMLFGAMLAGQSFANAPVGAVHALAYPLGGRFHIAHGLANALMLVPVLGFNARKAAALYAELGRAIADICPEVAQAGTNAAHGFTAAISALVAAAGAPCRLRDVGVPKDALPMLAADAMRQTRLLANNPVDLSEADARHLYEEAF